MESHQVPEETHSNHDELNNTESQPEPQALPTVEQTPAGNSLKITHHKKN